MITGQLFLFETPKCFDIPARMQTHAYVTSRWAFRVIYSDFSLFALLKDERLFICSLFHSIILSLSLLFLRLFSLSLQLSILFHLSLVPTFYHFVFCSTSLSFSLSSIAS